MDLVLGLDSSKGRRAGLEDALRRAVQSGQLRAGAVVPSSRSLATELGVARATVVSVYEQLIAEGYLVARQGAGTAVAALPGVSMARSVPTLASRPFLMDFLPGEPDHGSFPRRQWLAASRRAITSCTNDVFAYGDPRGLPALRSGLADYLGRTRAVVADPDNVSVFGGVASAFGFLAETFRRSGVGRIAVEDPSLPPLRRVLSGGGLDLVPVPVDGEGICVDALEGVDVAAVVVTPSHQYPLGVTLSPARRAALIDWARRKQAWIIEDDYDGEFRYDRQPVGSLQGLDPTRVVYAGTASKSLAAGMRIAWLVVPPELLDQLSRTTGRRAGVSTLEQAGFAEFLASRLFDRHVRAMRSVYRRRRDAAIEALAQDAPWLEPTGISAGLHFTGLLRQGGPTERELVALAQQRNIALFGLGDHRLALPQPDGLVIGYSRSSAHEFDGALEKLSAFFRSVDRSRSSDHE